MHQITMNYILISLNLVFSSNKIKTHWKSCFFFMFHESSFLFFFLEKQRKQRRVPLLPKTPSALCPHLPQSPLSFFFPFRYSSPLVCNPLVLWFYAKRSYWVSFNGSTLCCSICCHSVFFNLLASMARYVGGNWTNSYWLWTKLNQIELGCPAWVWRVQPQTSGF